MLRFGRNLETLDATIKYIGVAYGVSSDNIKVIKDQIKHKKKNS